MYIFMSGVSSKQRVIVPLGQQSPPFWWWQNSWIFKKRLYN